MTTKDNRTLKIVGGPSREELFDSLRLSHEHRTVDFKFEVCPGNVITITVCIRGIETEDGSGQSWCISANDREAIFGRGHLTGYYHGGSRTGFFVFSNFTDAEIRNSEVLRSVLIRA